MVFLTKYIQCPCFLLLMRDHCPCHLGRARWTYWESCSFFGTTQSNDMGNVKNRKFWVIRNQRVRLDLFWILFLRFVNEVSVPSALHWLDYSSPGNRTIIEISLFSFLAIHPHSQDFSGMMAPKIKFLVVSQLLSELDFSFWPK